MEERDPYSEMTVGSDGEDEDSWSSIDTPRSNDNDDEPTDTCKWMVSPSESVYDDGMYRILEIGSQFGKENVCIFGCHVLSIIVLLGFNAALQMMVTWKVYGIVQMSRSSLHGSVFFPTGSCAYQPSSLYTEVGVNAGKEPLNWDCGPLFPMLMSNVGWLDYDNDTYWSEADHLDPLSHQFHTKFEKAGNLTNIFDAFLKDAENGKLQYQIKRKMGPTEAKELTKGSRIPMEWMREEQPVIALCNNVDPHLCGNLEVRGSLQLSIPDVGRSPEARAQECRDMFDTCTPRFGELFRSYTKNAEQTCGSMSSTWDPVASVILNKFSEAEVYDPMNKDAIPTVTYEAFLLLVLIIWLLIVIGEVRNVFAWWLVLWCIPNNDSVVNKTETTITIPSISRHHKIIIALMVLAPRTLIICFLSYIGTDFLIIADSYSDLILNSVALGFLIEVDEMLFAAVTSQTTKDNISKLDALEGEHGCFKWCIKLSHFPTSIPLVFFVVLMAIAQISYAYYEHHGKLDIAGAYACLCHMEGPACIAAQILGGQTRVHTS